MKLFTYNTNYNETINIAIKLKGEYNKSVIFHCYWNGQLNEKHLYSILSCYYFNVYNNKHKIILWLDNNTPNKYKIIDTALAIILKTIMITNDQNFKIILFKSIEQITQTF